MTTPPAAASGQALPARVVELIERYGAAKLRRGMAISDAICDEVDASKAALVAAIADAIEEARREGPLQPETALQRAATRYDQVTGSARDTMIPIAQEDLPRD